MATHEDQQHPLVYRSSPSPEPGMDHNQDSLTLRQASPSPSASPTPAIGACPKLSRCVSTASSDITDFSASGRSSSGTRESLGSSTSRASSGSYTSRQSTGGLEKPKRRGYVRPQGTYFAASAQSRESVMSLGSIAHLQYYFARTGLLDGKGGRLKMKNGPLKELDLSSLNTDLLSPSDRDSSYSSSVSSPDFPPSRGGAFVESPIAEEPQSYVEDYDDFSDDEDHPSMLPPTVSTYNPRSKPIPRPPTLPELKSDLESALKEASKVLADAKAGERIPSPQSSPSRRHSETSVSSPDNNRGWYELQGMHILDMLTLAIRAAKIYYTAHDQPSRLATIKSERKIRSELLGVMDVLKRMATRNFAGGMKTEEREVMELWIAGVWEMLRQEEDIEEKEKEERRSWKWLDDAAWPSVSTEAGSVCIEREISFLQSMAITPSTILPHTPSNLEVAPIEPSPFLKSLQNGVTLINLHNECVKRSKRPFGAIPTYHTDTAKPYRMADNLRFWVKAAELRWEVVLKVDVMSVVNGVEAEAWKGFEAAIWRWCSVVRTELAAELKL